MARQSRAGASTPVLPSSCSIAVCGQGRAGSHSLLSLETSVPRHCWLAVPGARWTDEEPSCWRQDPEDYLPPTWPRRSVGEWESLLAKIYSAPTVGTSPPCQRMPGAPLLSGRDFRAICQPNSILVSSCGLLFPALLRSSQASPPHTHSHIVFCRRAVPRGRWRGTDLLPRRQAQILHYPTTDSALGRRALARRQRGTRPTTAALCLGLG